MTHSALFSSVLGEESDDQSRASADHGLADRLLHKLRRVSLTAHITSSCAPTMAQNCHLIGGVVHSRKPTVEVLS